mgnify:CR=1 FL=1
MSDFLKNIVKEVGNEYASIVDDGVEAGDVTTFIDTGSYILNGLLRIRLQHLQGRAPQVRRISLWVSSRTFLMQIPKQE